MANSFKFEIDFDASNVRALVIAPKNGACKLIFEDGSEKMTQFKMTKAGFVAPTLEDVRDYMSTFRERLYFSAEAFFNYYQAKNWKLGRGSVNDWKSLLRVWVEKDKQKMSGKPNPFLAGEQRCAPARNEDFDNINDIDNWMV